MDPLPRNPPRVEDVRQLHTSGPWPSKSGGPERADHAVSSRTTRFLDYDAAELERIGTDIRGVRLFYVHRARAGGVAATSSSDSHGDAFVGRGLGPLEFEGSLPRHRQPAPRPSAPYASLRSSAPATFEGEGGTLATLANTLHRDDPPHPRPFSAGEFQIMRIACAGTPVLAERDWSAPDIHPQLQSALLRATADRLAAPGRIPERHRPWTTFDVSAAPPLLRGGDVPGGRRGGATICQRQQGDGLNEHLLGSTVHCC